MSSPWLSAQELEAWQGLLHLTDTLKEALNRELQERHGLSLADYEVLGRVEAAEGGVRVKDLTATLTWEQSRISHQLNRLTKSGFVQKQLCDEDRRGSWFTLTDRGRAVMAAAAPDHVASVRRLFFDHLDPGAVQALRGVVRAVAAAPDRSHDEDGHGGRQGRGQSRG